MDKVWQCIIGVLLGAGLASFFNWKEQEPDKRLSGVFGIWWLTLSICSVILFFTGKPGSIYFLAAGTASLVTAACLYPERDLKLFLTVIGFMPTMSGLAIYLKGNRELAILIILPFAILQGVGTYLDKRRKQGLSTSTQVSARPSRGPQRGGSRR